MCDDGGTLGERDAGLANMAGAFLLSGGGALSVAVACALVVDFFAARRGGGLLGFSS
jgi:hypothetical protein